MLHAEVTLPGSTSSVPTARRFVESLLTSWGHPDLAWAAALCVSELAGNCALHARTRFAVRLELADGVARLEVSDTSQRAPSLMSYGTEATTGRGLRLVDEYAKRWGVEVTEAGKTVWAVLHDGPPASLHLVGDDDGSLDVDGLLVALDDGGDAPHASAASAVRQVAA